MSSVGRKSLRNVFNNLVRNSLTKDVVGKDSAIIHATAPTAKPLYAIIRDLPRLFPRSYADSKRDYEQFHKDPETMQEGLLRTLPFFERNAMDKRAYLKRTTIDDSGNYINELVIEPTRVDTAKKRKRLIFVHGYGAGLGFFLKNLENLPLLDDSWSIHAIDLPGYGFSSRMDFPFEFPRDDTTVVCDWFLNRMHKFFEKRGLNDSENIVMAHSMGAYLMSFYVNKYPDSIKKIIMCSPAGISRSQYSINNNTTDENSITNEIKKIEKKVPWWYKKFWDRNISPFVLVRKTSLLGSKITSGWTYRRFKPILINKEQNYEQFEAMHKYSYAIFNMKGSGEYLLSFVLECGGDPRSPLENSLFSPNSTDFGIDNNGLKKSNCDWVWVYGENDWMDINGARRVTENFLKRFGKNSKVKTISDSGHHLYFDNYKSFNSLLVEEMKSLQ
ncbi:hypothetical protein RNJ44_04299 [Nakaseomyces bracarensis]|uniref:AB hydrolase-1 domain-containing protein n=1 Tax=Nakaseomyces bracarensis TaxID=273131 RepID=A0ABR4NUL8_9SACH